MELFMLKHCVLCKSYVLQHKISLEATCNYPDAKVDYICAFIMHKFLPFCFSASNIPIWMLTDGGKAI